MTVQLDQSPNAHAFARTGNVLRNFLANQWHWLAAAVLFFVLAVLVHPYDQALSTSARDAADACGKAGQNDKPLDEFLLLFRLFGKTEVQIMLAVTVGLLGLRRRAMQMLTALLIVSALVGPAKVLVHAERPRGGEHNSFPSGDAASVTALVVPIVARTPYSLPVAGTVVALVGISRVTYGRHYPSDVLAGIGFGLVAGALACSFFARRGTRLRLRVRRWALVGTPLLLAACIVSFFLGNDVDIQRLTACYGALLTLLLARRYTRLVMKLPVLRRRALIWITAGWKPALITAAAILAVYILVACGSTLWDRDEPRFSRATVEMVQSGDYLVPTFNGELRPDKPILIYWLMSVPVKLLGQTTLACRLPALCAVALVCLMSWWMGRRIFGSSGAGLAAMAMLATTPLLTVSGTAATTDAVLLACILGAITLFLPALADGLGWGRAILIGLALGGALLTKGPVGLVIPILAVVAALLIARKELPTGKLRYSWLFISAALGLNLFLLWAIPADNATGGEFMARGLGHHVVERMAKAQEGHGGSFWAYLPYYIVVVAGGFFPWVLFLPGAFSALIGGRLAEPRARALLLGWVVTTFTLMTLVKTKLPHYVLPIWPALALMAAGALLRESQGLLAERDRRWLRRGAWLLLPLGAALGLALLVAPWYMPIFKARSGFWALGLLVLVMTWFAARELRAGRTTIAAATMLVGMLCFQIQAGLVALPGIERFKLSPAAAEAVRTHLPEKTPMTAWRYHEPSLVFYAQRPMESIEGRRGASDAALIEEWAARPGPGVLVIPRRTIRNAERDLGPLWRAELTSVSGINFSNGKIMEVVVLDRARLRRTLQHRPGAGAAQEAR